MLLDFIAPVRYCAARAFAHLTPLCGLHAQLRDLRLANVAAVVTTYTSHPALAAPLQRSLATLPDRERTSQAVATARLVHPVVSWLVAYEFYRCSVGRSPQGDSRAIYKALCQAERPTWEAYLADRVTRAGWNARATISGLRALPGSTPALHRWHLYKDKAHLGGHYTTERLHRANVVPAIKPCTFCGQAGADTLQHMMACPVTEQARRKVLSSVGRPGSDRPWGLRDLFLQCPSYGDDRGQMLAFFAALWGGAFHRPAGF